MPEKKRYAGQWTQKYVRHAPSSMHPETLNDKCNSREYKNYLNGQETHQQTKHIRPALNYQTLSPTRKRE
ncbi:MAG TPA: hypothetical protein VFM25_14230 [Verrucomicrobiae bacterium]|nr:hypothetical protein [Verrucomicrobiae bacterium]